MKTIFIIGLVFAHKDECYNYAHEHNITYEHAVAMCQKVESDELLTSKRPKLRPEHLEKN